jgi:hypothetical protein
MALEAIYKTKEAFEQGVDEGFRGLYSERSGQYEFTGVVGVKTQADVDRVLEGARKERNDHTQTKAERDALKSSLGAWAVLKPEEITAKIDGYDALALAAQSAGTVNADEISKRVQAELTRHTAPLERKITDLTTDLSGATEQITTFQAREKQRAIHDAVRKARIAAKVIDSAEEDALLLAERMFEVDEDGRVTTKEGVGVTPGVEPDVWFTEMQSKRQHWWPESVGGGARGGKGSNGHSTNPWSAKSWNVTSQMAFVREHGEDKAGQMAAMAGSSLGAVHPPKA